MDPKMFEVTQINFFQKKNDKGMQGIVSFLLNGSLRINDISVYQRLNAKPGEPTYRLVYPKKDITDKYQSFFPINDDARIFFEREISCYLDNVLKT